VRVLFAIAAAALVALLAPGAAAAGEVPAKANWTEAYIQTPGEPTLHVDVLTPKSAPPGAKLPAIVSVGPYFGHTGQGGPTLRFRDLIEQGKIFERGYALVQVDLRGFGGSAGCNDFGGRGEQNDAKRAVEWTTSQPWSSGRAAMWGKSYDAWTAVMAYAHKPKGLAAAVIQSPIIDGYRTLFQNGVHYDVYHATAQYQVLDGTPPTPFDSKEYFAGAATGTDPACYARNSTEPNAWQDPDDPVGYWKERDLAGARGSDVPTLFTHGLNDANTRPDNFLPLYSTLTGPKRAWFGQFAHDRPNDAGAVGRTGFFDDAIAWLDRYLKDDRSANPLAEPEIEVAEGDGRWRYEAQWPPADVVQRTMAVRPGSFTDHASTEFGTGDGTWSITPPLRHEARIAGTPRLSVDASSLAPRAHLIAQLYDIDEKLVPTLMHRGAHVVKSGAGRLTFEMYPNDWTVRAGHRLGLRLTADDPNWYLPPHSGAEVQVAGGTLELPFLAFRRDGFFTQKATPSMRERPKLAALTDVAADTVAFEAPQPAVTPPAAAEQGAVPAPPSARAPANRLKVTRRAVGRRRVAVTVRGAGGARVRVSLIRGRKTVARRTVTPRRGVARLTFRLAKAGRYRVRARTLGGVALDGASRPLRVR
jgi:hypothetical protein